MFEFNKLPEATRLSKYQNVMIIVENMVLKLPADYLMIDFCAKISVVFEEWKVWDTPIGFSSPGFLWSICHCCQRLPRCVWIEELRSSENHRSLHLHSSIDIFEDPFPLTLKGAEDHDLCKVGLIEADKPERALLENDLSELTFGLKNGLCLEVVFGSCGRCSKWGSVRRMSYLLDADNRP